MNCPEWFEKYVNQYKRWGYICLSYRKDLYYRHNYDLFKVLCSIDDVTNETNMNNFKKIAEQGKIEAKKAYSISSFIKEIRIPTYGDPSCDGWQPPYDFTLLGNKYCYLYKDSDTTPNFNIYLMCCEKYIELKKITIKISGTQSKKYRRLNSDFIEAYYGTIRDILCWQGRNLAKEWHDSFS